MITKWQAVRRLSAAGLLTPRAVWQFGATAAGMGANLAALGRFTARRVGDDRVALVDGGRRLTFGQLADESERLAAALRTTHGVRRGTPVGVLGRNSADFVLALFAASRLGARVLLLNPEMAPEQLAALIAHRSIGLVLRANGAPTLPPGTAATQVEMAQLAASAPHAFDPNPRVTGGEVVVLTGGTTGPPKAASRKPQAGNFGLLFAHLTTALGLDRHDRAYVAVPLFHGYGVAAFIVALALGRTVYLSPRFDAEAAAELIAREKIEVLAVVPLMLQRLLAIPNADLSPLKVMITGGAALAPTLATATRERLGQVLFNLYGTSEAGVSIFATPQDLQDTPDTIGRPIWGVRVAILSDADQPLPVGELGRLAIRSSAAAMSKKRWIETSDVGLRDAEGRIFLHGRADEMISSGGEKVHPWEVETEILRHPEAREAACLGVPDAEYGQRLVAVVAPEPGSTLTPEALADWLEGRVARYQRPRAILFRDQLPATAVGKLDKRILRASLPPEVTAAE